MRSHVKKRREKHSCRGNSKCKGVVRESILLKQKTERVREVGSDTRWREEVGRSMYGVGRSPGLLCQDKGCGRQQRAEGAQWGRCPFSESKDYGGLDLAGDKQINQACILEDKKLSKGQSHAVIPLAEAHTPQMIGKRGIYHANSPALPSPRGSSFPAHLLVEALQKGQRLVSLCSMAFCYISLHFMGKILHTAR